MAFTIQTVIADPTLTVGNMLFGSVVMDPTLGLTYTRSGAVVLDPTLVQGNVRLPFPSTDIGRLERITASGTASQSIYSSATLPGVTASGTAIQYPTGFSSETFERVTGSGSAFASQIPQLPLITGTGTALNGSVTSVNFPQELPYPVAYGRTIDVNASSASFQHLIASGTALLGVLATSAATLTGITAEGAAGTLAVGTSSVALPGVLAQGTASTGTGATFSTIVLQTVMQGLSTYSNFPFNSLAKFNGYTLGAAASGLYSLTGADDAGTQIDAAARFGVTDFNSSYRSRVERVYLGYRASADLVLRVRTDGTTIRDYRVPSNTAGGIHGTHVRLGRGLEARYWQFEIRNQAGCDFSVNVLETKRIRLSRRIGGADA